MTNLDKHVVQSLKQSPRTFSRGGVDYTIRATDAREGRLAADLEVFAGNEVVGYITPYSDSEHGAVKANQFGAIAPRLFRSVEAALDEIAS